MQTVKIIGIVLLSIVALLGLCVAGLSIASAVIGEKDKVGIPDSSKGEIEADDDLVSPLHFHADKTFKISFITDIQDVYPMNKTTKAFINEVLDREKPDIVILGGDNVVSSYKDLLTEGEENQEISEEQKAILTEEVKRKSIEELCSIFVNKKTYFSLVFGNHDHEQGYDDDHLLKLYQEYGQGYCLAYDSAPKITGTATHNITIKASDSDKDVFNLWMVDSNEYDGKGDGAVACDQVEWYNERCQSLASKNGGKVLPSFEFQHIVEHCVMDNMFVKLPSFAKNIGRATEDGSYVIFLKKWGNYEGVTHELICCGYSDHGFHDAMTKNGDVLACFSGHDHICNYKTVVDGIAYINTSACTFHCYNEKKLVGCRIIELNEDDLTTYTTRNIFVTDYAKEDGCIINTLGDMTQEEAKKLEKERKRDHMFFFTR